MVTDIEGDPGGSEPQASGKFRAFFDGDWINLRALDPDASPKLVPALVLSTTAHYHAIGTMPDNQNGS